jgi:hypothetical protein
LDPRTPDESDLVPFERAIGLEAKRFQMLDIQNTTITPD